MAPTLLEECVVLLRQVIEAAITDSGQKQFEGLAEREGFEPSIEFPLYTLSKRAPSTARPSLRGVSCLVYHAVRFHSPRTRSSKVSRLRMTRHSEPSTSTSGGRGRLL